VSADGALVSVDQLRKRYSGAPVDAVDGVSFDVREGEIFGLLGPNGAGKTTTIGTITTRVRLTSGRVVIDGFDVARAPVEVKQRIAVVPQRPNIDRSLTALENLVFHAAYFGEPRATRRRKAEELLARMGLEGRGGDKVDNYSGGMAQRLMIARALMHEPRLLILDEPTTGLDPQSRLFLWETMSDLRARGVTLMLTTHDMAEADRLCDRVAIVDHGKVIALDTPRGLRRLLPSEHGLEVVVAGTEPLAGADEGAAEEDRWRGRVYGDATPAEMARRVAEAGRDLIELRTLEGSLEDVFVHLTGRELR
jgi:ABC-2 type transport system ATP-binding protein